MYDVRFDKVHHQQGRPARWRAASYLGKACRQSPAKECFASHKLGTHDDVLARPPLSRRRVRLRLAAPHTRRKAPLTAPHLRRGPNDALISNSVDLVASGLAVNVAALGSHYEFLRGEGPHRRQLD